MSATVTVAIPTLDAGPEWIDTLRAIGSQRVDREVELLICDSGSGDDTVAEARRHGARVITIPRHEFGHGATRNRLLAEARGDHVALLTQDAAPAGDSWLAELLSVFSEAPDVGLAYGPYRPRPEASLMVRRELNEWFDALSPDGSVRIDRLGPAERDLHARQLAGPRGFFTDANACLDRAAWSRVPFRDVAYAEDHLLAHDMLRAGFAKAFVPRAAVIHSHDYTLSGWLRRSYDEARAMQEIYGWAPGRDPRAAVRNLRGQVGGDWRASGRSPRVLAQSLGHHGARAAGGLLGARAGRLPHVLRARFSLEGRG